MSLGLRLTFDIISGAFADQMKEREAEIATAATRSMDGVVAIVKKDSRLDIARAGFSTRVQNALRVNRYPERRNAISINPAAYVFHKIDYMGVFEDGATIKGSPMLWLPLSTTPQSISGRRTRPAALAATMGQRLISFTSRNGTPLLGARVEVSRTQAVKSTLKVSLAALRRGNTGKKAEGSSLFRTIPLFFGVRETHIPKKLSIREICAKARDRIPALYAAALAEVVKG
jgi:hypothetical protein